MKLLHLIAVSCVVCACSDVAAPTALRAPSSPRHDTDQNVTVPIAFASVNQCNGDVVALTGESHILIHSTSSGGGNNSMYVATNSRLSGDGLPSGVGYQASQDAFDQFSYADPFPLEETVHVDLQLQSQTGVDNYHVGFDIHLTFNANGVPTATTNKFIDRCNG